MVRWKERVSDTTPTETLMKENGLKIKLMVQVFSLKPPTNHIKREDGTWAR